MKRLYDALGEAIAALESGRDVDVEYRYRYTCGGWTLLNIEQCDYRCRIKPREIWVNEYSSTSKAIHNSREEADERAGANRISCTRFVEAINDD